MRRATSRILSYVENITSQIEISFATSMVKRKINNLISYSIIFRKRSRLKILLRHGYLTIIDATHNTNRLYQKLFTMIIRHKIRIAFQGHICYINIKMEILYQYFYLHYRNGVADKVVDSHNISSQITLLLSNVQYP